eukprot:TRINITY_DN5531_c0_g1_i4.p1 TRINITY_DN5531_c0_g1~~TRINITY_DN5531_c0_g1_i4.p1  ORF type:complete len:293 (-),score=77.94 TRINITY_DN5531_c0_g1_i4:87-905(-)
MNDTLRQVLIAIGFIFLVIINILSNAAPFNGRTTRDVVNQYPTCIKPDGFTFSVWGVIYFFEGLFTLYQLLPSTRELPFLRAMGPWAILNFILNPLWLMTWPYDAFWVSQVVISMNLYCLYRIYLILDVAQKHPQFTLRETVCVKIGFSCNVSWIVVANLANITTTLRHEGYVPPSDWACAWLIVAITLAVYVACSRADISYCLVAIWALLGIAREQYTPARIVAVTSYIGVATIAFFLLVALIYHWFTRQYLLEAPEEQDHVKADGLMRLV